MNGEVTDLSSRASTRRPRRSSSGHAPKCHPPDAQQPLLQPAAAPPLQNVALGAAGFDHEGRYTSESIAHPLPRRAARTQMCTSSQRGPSRRTTISIVGGRTDEPDS